MSTLLLVALAGLANPPSSPLHCPSPIVDRGDVKGGPPLTQSFDLTHRGTAGTITITRVEASCGCLRRSLSGSQLQPGETARLALEVNTLTQPDGPNRWQAVVGYSLTVPGPAGSPPTTQTGELALAVTAKLSREVTVSPAQLGFSTTGAATQTLTLTDHRDKPLTVLRAAGSSPHLTAAIAPPVAAPNGTRTQTITIELSAAAPPGRRDEAIVLATDDPAYPEFRIPVRVLKRQPGGVTAAPEAVSLRFATGQTDVSTLVQMRGSDGKAVAIASATCDDPAVALKWSPESGRVAALRVTVARGTADKPGQCLVRVRFAKPAGQELAIPVSWR